HTRFSRDWSSDVCSSDLDCNPSQTLAETFVIVQPGTLGTSLLNIPFSVLNVAQSAGIPLSKFSTNWLYPLPVNNKKNIVDKSKNLFIKFWFKVKNPNIGRLVLKTKQTLTFIYTTISKITVEMSENKMFLI